MTTPAPEPVEVAVAVAELAAAGPNCSPNRHYKTCSLCNYDTHDCPGCGAPTGHVKDNQREVCAECSNRLAAEELAAADKPRFSTLAEAEEIMRTTAGKWVPQGVCALVMAEFDRRGQVLDQIAEAHSKNGDRAGGNRDECAECGWSWPCATNVWATTSRDVMAPWIPAEDERAIDE